jgi:hypothetical protein
MPSQALPIMPDHHRALYPVGRAVTPGLRRLMPGVNGPRGENEREAGHGADAVRAMGPSPRARAPSTRIFSRHLASQWKRVQYLPYGISVSAVQSYCMCTPIQRPTPICSHWFGVHICLVSDLLCPARVTRHKRHRVCKMHWCKATSSK